MSSVLLIDVRIRDYPSRSRDGVTYSVRLRLDAENHRWLSCNCPAWTRGRQQAGKSAWERTCKHTENAERDLRLWNWLSGQVNSVSVDGKTYSANDKLQKPSKLQVARAASAENPNMQALERAGRVKKITTAAQDQAQKLAAQLQREEAAQMKASGMALVDADADGKKYYLLCRKCQRPRTNVSYFNCVYCGENFLNVPAHREYLPQPEPDASLPEEADTFDFIELRGDE